MGAENRTFLRLERWNLHKINRKWSPVGLSFETRSKFRLQLSFLSTLLKFYRTFAIQQTFPPLKGCESCGRNNWIGQNFTANCNTIFVRSNRYILEDCLHSHPKNASKDRVSLSFPKTGLALFFRCILVYFSVRYWPQTLYLLFRGVTFPVCGLLNWNRPSKMCVTMQRAKIVYFLWPLNVFVD